MFENLQPDGSHYSLARISTSVVLESETSKLNIWF